MAARAITFVDFASRILRLTFTRGQRVLAKVAIDGVQPKDLVGEERDVARCIFGDLEEVPAFVRAILCLELGRDSGKTLFAAALAVYFAFTADLSTRGPGDVPCVVITGPRQRTARNTLRVVLELLRRGVGLKRHIVSVTSDVVTLQRPDGRLVTIEAFPMSEAGTTVRGRSVIAIIFDEAQFLRSDDSFVATDRAFYAGVSPRLLVAAIFISTRWPSPTLMRELVDKNLGTPSTALAARADTLTMRDGDPEVQRTIDREMAIDEANCRREFYCDDSGTTGETFFDHRALAAAVDAEATMLAPKGARIAIGVDIGLVRDSSAIVVAARDGETVRVVFVDELRPRKGEPLRLSAVIAHFAEVARRYGERRFIADGHAREPAREFAEAEKVTIDAAPEGRSGKEATHLAVRKLLTEGRLRLPNHPRLLEQLRSIVARPMEGGGLAFVSPRRAGNAHGDIASACILACAELAAAEQRIFRPRIVPGGGYRFNQLGPGRGFG